MRDAIRRVVTDEQDPTEQAAARKLGLEYAPTIDALQAQVIGDPERGSSLAHEDTLTAPFQISHAIGVAIAHAIDDLAALRALTVRRRGDDIQVVTVPYAGYPLLRAAVENAGTALWLLSGTRRQRLTRRFRLAYEDGRNLRRLQKVAAPDGPLSTWREPRLEGLIEHLHLERKECRQPVGYAEIVADAADLFDAEPARLVALWRSLSALSHGDMWASVALTEHSEVTRTPDGTVITMQVTASLKNTAAYLRDALVMTRAAVEHYKRRRVPPSA